MRFAPNHPAKTQQCHNVQMAIDCPQYPKDRLFGWIDAGRKLRQKAASLPDRPIDRKVFVTIDPQDRPQLPSGFGFRRGLAP